MKKNILLLVLVAVTTSILFNLTNLLLAWDTGISAETGYTYFTFLNPDAMSNLAPMVRDVFDGHWFPSDGRLAEHATAPNLWSPLTPILFAPFLFLVRSVPLAFLASKLTVAAVSYLLFYLLALRIVGRRSLAAVFAAVFLLAPLLWSYLPPTSISNVRIVARTILPAGSPPSEVLLSRYNSFSIMPALPFMILGLLLIYFLLERKTIRWGIAAGINIGFLVIIYLTHAIYLLAILGIAAVVLRAYRERELLRTLMWTGIAAAATAAPFIWNFFHIRLLPHADEFYRRLGGDQTHAFRWSEWPDYLLYAAFAFITYRVATRARRPVAAAFLAGCILAAVAVENIQVILGYNPAPTVWRGHQIFFGFALAWLFIFSRLYEWSKPRIPRGKIVVPAFALLLALMIAGRAVYAEAYAFGYMKGLARLPSYYGDAFNWLEKNTPIDTVVVTPSLATNSLLPYLTHSRTMIGRAITSPASENELIDRLLLTYALFDVPAEHLERGLRQQITLRDSFTQNAENGLVAYLYEYRFVGTGLNAFYNEDSTSVPEDVVQKIVLQYTQYPRRPGYLFGRYQNNYLFVGPLERQIMRGDFDALPYLSKVYDANNVQIYAVRADVLPSL